MATIQEILRNTVSSQAFTVGQQVTVNYTKKGYDDKSVYRDMLEKMCEYWQKVKLTNDPRYGTKGDYRKTDVIPYLSRKKKCLGKLWDEKKEWIRTCLELIEKPHTAYIVEVHFVEINGLNEFSPSHLYYVGRSKDKISLLRYKVIICDEQTGVHFCHMFLEDQLIKA